MPLHRKRTLAALLAAVDWAASGDFAAARRLGDAPVDGELVKLQADGAVRGARASWWSR